MSGYPVVRPAGEQAVLVRFGESISSGLHAKVRACLAALDRRRPEWVTDCVPAYCSILVVFDPRRAATREAVGWVEECLAESAQEAEPQRSVAVPVWYDLEVGPDLAEVARAHDLGIDELIGLHAGSEYVVFMLGFKPGFPFMGGLPERLWTPRLPEPRSVVPAGSVAIAGRQAGIYPVSCPGGWRILGRTPLRIFDPRRAEPFLLLPGDRVRFQPIAAERFRELESGKDGAG